MSTFCYRMNEKTTKSPKHLIITQYFFAIQKQIKHHLFFLYTFLIHPITFYIPIYILDIPDRKSVIQQFRYFYLTKQILQPEGN